MIVPQKVKGVKAKRAPIVVDPEPVPAASEQQRCPRTGNKRPMLATTPYHVRKCKFYEPFAKSEEEEFAKLKGAELLRSRIKPDMLKKYIE